MNYKKRAQPHSAVTDLPTKSE